jgi:hypothetical protein
VVTDRFAFPGLALATYEIEGRNAAWESDHELLFVEVGADGVHELRRWSAASSPGESELLYACVSPRELADVLPARGGEPALVLETPTARERVFSEPGPHEFVVRALVPEGPEGSTRPLARVQIDKPAGIVRLLGRRAGAAVLAVAEFNPDWSFRLRIQSVSGDRAQELGTVDRTVSTGIVLDEDGDRVVFSSKDPRDDVYNLFEQSLATGDRRQLTFNRRPGILFSDLVVLPERRILLAITALTSTINLLELKEKDASEASAPKVTRARAMASDVAQRDATEEGIWPRRGRSRKR